MTDELSPLARMRESAAQRELGDLKTDMQRWAELNRIAIAAEVRRELEGAVELLRRLVESPQPSPDYDRAFTQARDYLARRHE